jgi:hypothetical protein
MIRLLFLSLVLVLPTWAYAQQVKNFYTVSECGAPLDQFSFSIDLDEEILFEGTSVVKGSSGTPFFGGMLFTVNQDTGTWTLFSLYADGTVCTIAFGEDFQPSLN